MEELRGNARHILIKIGALDPDGSINHAILHNPEGWLRPETGNWKDALRIITGCGPKTHRIILKAAGEKVPSEQTNIMERAQDVKLMLWAFGKIGTLERIERAYKASMIVCIDD